MLERNNKGYFLRCGVQKVYISFPVFAAVLMAFNANATEANLPSNVVLDKNSTYYNQDVNKITYTNDGTISTSSGGNTVLINAGDAAVDIVNKGEINASSSGFGIYGFTNPTTGGPVYIENQGTIERIQLQEVDQVKINNLPASDQSGASVVPTIKGSVLLGTNAVFENLGGNLENLNDDSNGNTISFASNGGLYNGVSGVYDYVTIDETTSSYELVGLKLPASNLTTDNIIFTSNGFFANGSVVDVKNVSMGNGATILNVADPYMWKIDGENVAGKVLPNGATFTAENVFLGDDSTLSNEMGTTFDATNVSVGKNTVITNGADYYFDYKNSVEVTTVAVGGDLSNILGGLELTPQTTYIPIPKIPHLSVMNVDNLTLADGASLVNANNSTYTGSKINFSNSGTLDIQSGTVNVSGDITFLNNGTLNVSSAYQQPVYVPMKKEGSSSGGAETGSEGENTGEAAQMMMYQVMPISDAGRLSDAEIDYILSVIKQRDPTVTDEALARLEAELKLSVPADPDGKFTPEELESIINSSLNGVDPDNPGLDNETGGSGGTTSPGGTDDETDGPGGTGNGSGSSIIPTVPDELKDYIEYTKVLDGQVYNGILNANNVIMGDNATVNISGGQVNTGKMEFGDNSVLTIQPSVFYSERSETTSTGETVIIPIEETVIPTLTATDGIYFGNSSRLVFGGAAGTATSFVYTPKINFLNDGSIGVSGDFTLYADSSKQSLGKINMGERGYIEASGRLKADITLGSDSNVKLTNIQEEEDETPLICDHCIQAGTILGSLKKADGAENVRITVNVDETHYAKLDGDINVDSILVDVGLLEAAGEVKGNIYLNTDTTFRVTSSSIKDGPLILYDPINRLDNTSNTTVEVAMKDKEFYQTTNTINVENLLVRSGGIEINKAVNIDNVLLDSNTTIRLTDNFKIGSIGEVDGDRVNTTLEIDAKGKSVNSSGDVYVDRILVSSGNYNALHNINIATSSDGVSYPTYYEEGIELGTDASLTAYADIAVSRVVRDQEKLSQGEKVENTTLTVNSNHFEVRGNVDVDNLNMNGGVFEFLNELGTNAVNVTNDIHLKPYSALAGSGVLNIKTGTLSIDENSRLAVSNKSVQEKAISELKIVSSDDTIINSGVAYETKDLTVKTDSTGYIDVRADGDKSDKITVEGTVNLADGTRVIVRDIQANQEYEILSATQLHGNSDKLRTTFLWKGTDISTNNNTLSLKITGIQTLKEGITSTDHSKNVDSIASLLTGLRESVGAYTIDPFIDNVYFAHSAEEAVEVMNEYSPEGYLNTQQAALRLQKVFKEGVLSEMNAMRNYRVKHDLASTYYVRQPYYYGRPGYERYYYGFRQVRRNPYGQRRSDRGGLWAKPFAMSFSQEDKDHQSGYDFDAQGFTAGIDRKVGVFTLGIAGMYASGDMEQKNKKFQSDMTTYGVGVYGSITPHYSRSFMDFYALWSQTSNTTSRKVESLAETAKADFNVTAYTIGADIGYEIMLSRNFIITPKVGIDYTSVEMDEVTEKGVGYSLVNLKSAKLSSIQTPVELKAALDFGNPFFRFRPEAHVRWTHEFGDTASKSTARFVKYAAPFAVEGLNTDRDTFTVGGSLLWLYGLSELELKYDYDFSSTSTGHTINMGYKYLF